MPDPPKTTRRAFLAGRSAAEALAGALDEPPLPLPVPASTIGAQPGSHLLSVSREAMACLFEIVFDAAQYREQTEAAVAALDRVEALESQLTVYRQSSELMHINRQAATQPVAVERGLFELLERARTLSRETGGAFDITTGRLSKTWGFYRRQGCLPSADEITAALAGVGIDNIEFNDAASTLRFLHPNIELNLGAIGKGYTLDRAAAVLETAGIHDFLLHGGNSSVLARGKRILDSRFSILDSDEAAKPNNQSAIHNPQSAIPPGWSIALRHPLRPDQRLAEFILRDQALGTSGSGAQFFHHQGRRYGHILDPRTGWPAQAVLSATAIAPTAEQADALSTAFYVLGLAGTQQYCDQHPNIAALLCTATNSGAGIEMHPIHLADDAWRALA